MVSSAHRNLSPPAAAPAPICPRSRRQLWAWAGARCCGSSLGLEGATPRLCLLGPRPCSSDTDPKSSLGPRLCPGSQGLTPPAGGTQPQCPLVFFWRDPLLHPPGRCHAWHLPPGAFPGNVTCPGVLSSGTLRQLLFILKTLFKWTISQMIGKPIMKTSSSSSGSSPGKAEDTPNCTGPVRGHGTLAGPGSDLGAARGPGGCGALTLQTLPGDPPRARGACWGRPLADPWASAPGEARPHTLPSHKYIQIPGHPGHQAQGRAGVLSLSLWRSDS